jgi:hypothetical protein
MTVPPECAAARRRLVEALDTPAGLADAAPDPHLSTCPECRAWLHAAGRLQRALVMSPSPALPAGWAERVAGRARRERRRRLLVRTGGLALAACVVVAAGWIALTGTPTPPVPPPPAPGPLARETPTPPAGSLGGALAEAGSAVLDLTRRTADETVGPARLWLPEAEPVAVVAAAPAPATPLAGAGEGLANGFEPMTRSAARALDLWRELAPLDLPPPRSGS